MEASPERRVVDATSLQGLAHPLRVQLCDLLAMHGPATATQLAARLGESSGATSYHLRQLAKYGFVEEDESRGTGRERWWRRVPGGITIGRELADSPATRDATMLVVGELNRAKQLRAQHWRDHFHEWPVEWCDASVEASSHLKLTAAELAELNETIDKLVTGWVERTRGRPGDGYVDVELQWTAFPVGDPPPAGEL